MFSCYTADIKEFRHRDRNLLSIDLLITITLFSLLLAVCGFAFYFPQKASAFHPSSFSSPSNPSPSILNQSPSPAVGCGHGTDNSTCSQTSSSSSNPSPQQQQPQLPPGGSNGSSNQLGFGNTNGPPYPSSGPNSGGSSSGPSNPSYGTA